MSDQLDCLDLLAADVVSDLIGVIDLKNGLAVHAIAGARSDYQPIKQTRGDAIALAELYWSCGVRRLYVADLNGLASQQPQTRVLGALVGCRDWEEVLIDCGTQDESFLRFADQPTVCRLIVATEAAETIDRLQQGAKCFGPDRVVLGLDYRDGRFLSLAGDDAEWISAARASGISRAVVLDVSCVGTGDCSVAIARCQRVGSIEPKLQIYSGGGIRNRNDIASLRQAGCTSFLVATAILDS